MTIVCTTIAKEMDWLLSGWRRYSDAHDQASEVRQHSRKEPGRSVEVLHREAWIQHPDRPADGAGAALDRAGNRHGAYQRRAVHAGGARQPYRHLPEHLLL